MEMIDLTPSELESIEGGIIPLLLIGAAILGTSCGNSQTNNNDSGPQSVNINCSNCTIIINGDSTSVKVIQH